MNRFLRKNLITLFILLLFSPSPMAQNSDLQEPLLGPDDVRIEMTDIIVKNIKTPIKIHFNDPGFRQVYEGYPVTVTVNGEPVKVKVVKGAATLDYTFKKKQTFQLQVSEYTFARDVRPIPLWFSIIPPLIAILFALIFKEVFTALFIGILVGTTTMFWYQDVSFFPAIFKGIFAIVDTYVLEALTQSGHMAIIIFSMLIGAMVNIITRNGGMKGIVNILSRYANSPRSGQFVTWLLGIAIFFDDYANTLVVGNTMRPVTDRLKISREKLAYIVDSTAAPIAAIAFVTTWIGAELSYIQDGIATIGIDESPYNVFINSLAYSFYPIFALVFILILIRKQVDYGPMFHAEKKARLSEAKYVDDDNTTFSNQLNELEVPEHIRPRWYNAAIPVFIVIFGTFAGLLYTGWNQEVWADETIGFSKKLSVIIGNSDSYKALLWSSISGVLAAILLTISQKILNLKNTVDSMINGFRTMLTAIVILILAWSIALVTKHLHTADFISQTLVSVNIAPQFIPALTFILAALVAFSTGSSWGTMAILYPLILPASWLIAQNYGMEHNGSLDIFHNVVSAVLAGSVLGDHCSPISDTTILSSLASSCNHIDHVRTQLPYALTVGGVAIAVGTIPAAFGISSWFLFPAGILVLYLIVRVFAKEY
ncbi:MAG: Na+/H+ antiporter NhaC family protein [Bacteroidales bacterium]|jgi:Na+/H+ antiporter NhaC|nr:Na+/H+ antiporter NhaC family protein [Bacteroidales bacterium]